MVNKRNRGKGSRSRSESRARSTSRSRTSSKMVTVDLYESGTKPRVVEEISQSPGKRAEKTLEEVGLEETSVHHVRTRSSVHLIEKVDVSLTPPRPQASLMDYERPRKFGFFVDHTETMHLDINRSAFFKGIAYLFSALLIPLFVYWCIFLVFAPTSEKSFSRVRSHHGYSIVIAGAALPFDLEVINPFVLVGVLIFHRFTMLLNLLVPIGTTSTVVASGRRWQHKANGILVALLYLLAVVFYEHKVADFVGGPHLPDLCNLLPSIFLSAWFDSFVFAVLTFLESRHTHASPTAFVKFSGNFFVDFYNGRESRPMICGMDVKVLSYYTSTISCLLIQLAFAARHYRDHGSLNFALMILLLLHSVALMDFFIYEPTVLNDDGVMYYGCGLRWFQSMFLVWPFLQSLSIFYLSHDYRVVYASFNPLPDYLYAAIGAAIFIVGIYIRRRAINEKFLFHYDPQNPLFRHVQSFGSTMGKRILAGGWWAWVRHPDYLGGLIVSIGLAISAGASSFIPWIAPACVLLEGLWCLHWDEEIYRKNCDEDVWMMYTTAVPFRLIPWVY